MSNDDRIANWFKLVFVLIIAGALFNAFVMPRLVAWWEVNWIYVVIVTAVIAGIAGLIFFRWLLKPTPVSTAKRFESEDIRHQYIDSEPSLTQYNSLVHAIEDFKPFRKYKFENQYQIDLARHLEESFHHVVLEQQIGSSRPDIVVEKIAIEVKGPTTTRSLQTISDKILRYYNNFEAVVIVLFDVQMTESYYDEWHSGIQRHYPRVKVVKMDI